MIERVERVLNRIRPAIRLDGGDIELVDVRDGVVTLKLLGSCSACASSMEAVQRGIERAIRAEVPEIDRVDTVS